MSDSLAVRLAVTEARLPGAGLQALAHELGVSLDTVRELRTDPAYLEAKESQGLSTKQRQQLKTVAFHWMMECFAAPCDDATRLRIATMVLAADFADQSYKEMQTERESEHPKNVAPEEMTVAEAAAYLKGIGL